MTITMAWLSLGSKYLLENKNYYRYFIPLLQKSTRIDAIECFTSDLTEKKKLKWEILRKDIINKRFKDIYLSGTSFTTVLANTVLQDLNNINSLEIELNIDNLNSAQLDNILITTLKTENLTDFYNIIKQCLSKTKLPSEATIIECLKYLSMSGKTDLLTDFAELLAEKESKLFFKYNNLLAFKGLSLWKNGKLELALDTLLKTYKYSEIKESRKYTNYVFQVITSETLSAKSDAVLVCLLKTAKEIHKSYKDVYLLECIWKNCFKSKWFSDQKLAHKIFDDFIEVREVVGKQSWSMCANLLINHELELAHQLIELFLKYEMKYAYKNCLYLLFDYHYYRKDLRNCSEIIRTCGELELPVINAQIEKILNLILKRPPAQIKYQKPNHKFVYKF